MKMEKRTFRIGQLTRVLSKEGLEIEPSVIRFWEKEFDIRPKRSNKGQRYYDEKDLSQFVKIRELLYERRFTIEGARQALGGDGQVTTPTPVQRLSAQKQGCLDHSAFLAELTRLRGQLKKFRDLL